MISIIPVADEDLDKMKAEKGDNYEWATALTGFEKAWLSAINLQGEYKDVLKWDGKKVLLLQCLKCNSHFFIGECANCSGQLFKFSIERSRGDNLDTELMCGTCGNHTFVWQCPQCGSQNPLYKNRPYVYTIYWLEKKKRCFIATTVYGSYSEPDVLLLRQFRDQILLKSPLGNAFVSFYYLISPPIANFISNREILKKWMRLYLIEPFVKYVRKMK